MLEIESLFESYFQGRVFSVDYNWSEGSYGVPDDDSDIAIIREFLQSNVGAVRLSAEDAYAATSMAQMFVDAAVTISDKLSQMEQLAEKAAYGHYTNNDKAVMQKQFGQLALEINDIVDNTEYEGNKLFTAEGEVITRPLGNGQTIKLFARDLSLDITNLDLARDAMSALAVVETTITEANEYTQYLSSQNKLLQDAVATIENMMAGASGAGPSDFETKIAEEVASYLGGKIVDEPDISSQIQSNITAEEALQLLKD